MGKLKWCLAEQRLRKIRDKALRSYHIPRHELTAIMLCCLDDLEERLLGEDGWLEIQQTKRRNCG